MIKYFKLLLIFGCFVFPAALFANANTESSTTVQGKVCMEIHYDLENGCSPEATGLEGIMVSNQREVVLTDENGLYELPVEDGSVIYVSKPSDYQYILDKQNLPLFYHIHHPKGSPEELEFKGIEPNVLTRKSVDFALAPSEKKEEFTAVIIGDPQTRNNEELSYFRDDILSELSGMDAHMTMVLGDIMYDDLSYYKRYNQLMSKIGNPVFNVLGNHDMNYDADLYDDPNKFSRDTFKSFYGPTYYSFQEGEVHFIIMDNIDYLSRSEDTGRPQYRGYFSETHLEWIENVLNFVPDDKLIVLASHLPLYGMEHDRGNINTLNREKLFALLEGYNNVLYLGGHRHLTYHHFLGEEFGRNNPNKLHHITVTAACGSWWNGPIQENGVPVSTQQDGVPNGYHVVKFKGNSYIESFKAAGKPEDYQMRIESPVSHLERADSMDSEILVNVFNGSEKTIVRYRIDEDNWQEMKRMETAYSPHFQELFADYPSSATPTNHIWSSPLPKLDSGTYLIDVWSRDMHGQEFELSKIIEVE